MISIYFKRKTWNNIDRKDREMGRNMILIKSGKGSNMILIRAHLNREKILLIADRAQIDCLLVLWRAWQERVGRDKSVSKAQLDHHQSGDVAGIKSPPIGKIYLSSS